ncbi:MAG: sigma-54-dependent Fis family transcriptional regulator [Gammaproteobacteria bacterium]|nr:sigma-54-dependent Fis family transcriptional regulator [Gammaproteobacteria bacterium]
MQNNETLQNNLAATPLPRILIIEDEPDVARMLSRLIAEIGDYQVNICLGSGELEQYLATPPDLILTDLMMPQLDGFQVIERAKRIDADLPVVVVSAYATLENAVAAMRAGAFDFLPKPFSPESIELMLTKVLRDHGLRNRVARATQMASSCDGYLSALRGQSPAMQRLREWILKVRDTQASVLIEGESGTGKELVASALHAGQGPYVAINMAAIPAELAEAELFGYRKGAFTGASRDNAGLMMQATGGVLFLDEVNATPPALQAKLLRCLQSRTIRPLGEVREQPINFRLISASNQPLEQIVEEGGFRDDLLYRIKVLHISLPPLRERPEDIPDLAEHFVRHYARTHGRPVRHLSPEAIQALLQYPWPGNVRELENFIEQAVILCPNHATALPLEIFPASLGGASPGTPTQHTGLRLADVERHHIEAVLKECEYNKAKAARLLDIDYKTLLRKLSSWNKPTQA